MPDLPVRGSDVRKAWNAGLRDAACCSGGVAPAGVRRQAEAVAGPRPQNTVGLGHLACWAGAAAVEVFLPVGVIWLGRPLAQLSYSETLGCRNMGVRRHYETAFLDEIMLPRLTGQQDPSTEKQYR
ncbi:hypothetical protein NDU88_009951 [Pleurodeles waltl]|uniref:Uncharacterized protein n=1 Tax=Pleurodeles waltl TaxID=8319 RepID=A0AAV7RWP3_PLEWA|nr:hypothetical protein NDU88_009951 [Pleurodeles waltl]